MPIQELSESLAVSHIPIREALKRLEVEGLVRLPRGRAAVVTGLGPVDLHEMLGACALLEAHMFAAAISHYGDGDLVRIERRLGELRNSCDGSVQQLARLQGFHRALLKPGADSWTLRLFAVVEPGSLRYVHVLLAAGERAPSERLAGLHDELREVAAGTSPADAAEAMRRYFEYAEAAIVPLLADSAVTLVP